MKTSAAKGFTLLELLVVMTIIALLAGGIFSAAQFALRKAKQVQAQNICVGIATGVNNFRSDYSRWHVSVEASSTDADFMRDLLGKDTTKFNKRGRNFVDGLPVAKGSPLVGGLVISGTSGTVVDPWEQLFIVHIDVNGDGQVKDPEGGSELPIKVAVLSKGMDRIVSGTNEEGVDAKKDNAKSW